jgi:hypothetical protein
MVSLMLLLVEVVVVTNKAPHTAVDLKPSNRIRSVHALAAGQHHTSDCQLLPKLD